MKRGIVRISVQLIMLFSIIGCQSDTMEGGNKTTAAPTESISAVTPTATINPYIECAESIKKVIHPEWEVRYCENFNPASSAWKVGPDSYENLTGERSISDGFYRWKYAAKAGKIIWENIPYQTSGDFEYTIYYRMDSKYRDSEFDLWFTSGENSSLLLGLDNSSSYSFQKYADGQWYQLIPWKPHSAIKKNNFNEVTIIRNGDNYSFYVNGQLINSKDTPATGGSGFLFGIWLNKGVTATFDIDTIVVRTP